MSNIFEEGMVDYTVIGKTYNCANVVIFRPKD